MTNFRKNVFGAAVQTASLKTSAIVLNQDLYLGI